MKAALDRSYGDFMSAAQAAVRAGDLDGAERLAAEISDRFPHLPGGIMLGARCAALRMDWREALRRWDLCRETFPTNPKQWALGRATVLHHLGCGDEAEGDFLEAIAAEPDNLSARIGLARLVATGRDPDRTVELWRDVLRRGGDRPSANWRTALAAAQCDAGRHADALETVHSLLRDEPENRQALSQYCLCLVILGRRAEAMDAVTHGPFAASRGEDAMLQRIRVYAWLSDLTAARNCFQDLFARSVRTDIIAALMEIMPRLFEAWDRTRIWLAIRRRLAEAPAPDTEPMSAAHACLAMRISIALRDHDRFLAEYAAAPPLPDPWRARFARLATVLGGARFPDFAAPRIFGIGLSRTGTTTLASALEKLGYLTAHYNNPFSGAILSESDFAILDAASDIPVCQRFETLFHTFPNARFILTQRSVDDWVTSFERLMTREHGSADFPTLARQSTLRGDNAGGEEFASLNATLYFNYDNPRAAHAAYMRRVDSFFTGKRRGRLLRFDVFAGDGWPELCTFLARDIPDGPFPWENRAPSPETK